VRYIAFLDSDDEWSVEHIARARFALARGYDVFFGDLLHPGAETTAWRRAKTIRPDEHPVIEGMPGLHSYGGDMFDQILSHNVIGTPTVVYDCGRFPDTRFRVEYENFGEDYLFWIDLSRAGATFAFSSQCEAICGYGVNVFVSAGWGTDAHFLRLHNHMKYCKTVLRTLPVSSTQRKRLHGAIARLRVALARDILHRVSHGKPLRFDWLKAQAALDPRTIVEFPWHALTSVLGRGRSRAD
jgi:succinoglycan biosynthesis protein ExoW